MLKKKTFLSLENKLVSEKLFAISELFLMPGLLSTDCITADTCTLFSHATIRVQS